MMYQCGRCGLTRASGQVMGLAMPQCQCPWEFNPPVAQTQQQRTWIGLTDEEISAVDWKSNETLHDFARAIEAKLRSRNYD